MLVLYNTRSNYSEVAGVTAEHREAAVAALIFLDSFSSKQTLRQVAGKNLCKLRATVAQRFAFKLASLVDNWM